MRSGLNASRTPDDWSFVTDIIVVVAVVVYRWSKKAVGPPVFFDRTLPPGSLTTKSTDRLISPRITQWEGRQIERAMKFKAFLTQDGVHLLDKRFLPALDKLGRICHVYLTPDHAMFLQNLLSGDGVQSVAQFNKDVLFRDYRISSQNAGRIAFAVDVALLHRALRSALTIQAQARDDTAAIQIKLVKKLPAGSRDPAPFLTFETKGRVSAVVQDVPISKPLPRDDVQQLQSALEAAQDLPQTLVQVQDLAQLQSLVDRLRNVGDLLTVAITRYGDLHLQVSTSLITVGSEFRRLRVLGLRADPPIGDRTLSAPTRTEMAIQKGEGLSVQVSLKHLAKSLQCHLAKPDCAFYGIAPQGACLTVIFQFFIPGTRLTDKSISFYCRLPVLDPGSGP
ncbi:Hus1-like protein [Musa troglodytarum]|uniref:Hus1-like protein n=2 Tax=Musa troglodytarum TaxID=320322 RepID=A0A9E7FKI0_9LILI|nr:Hus1-like protein [Musa troglodytarum]